MVLGVEHVWHHAMPRLPSGDARLKVIVRGEGIYVYDSDGRKYIDAVSGQAVSQIGHGRREMAVAISRQVEELEFSPLAFGFTHPRAAELATVLSAVTPGDVQRAFFVSSGSEAVEAALKMARQYHRRRGSVGRYKVVARRGSYHGVTFGAMSATAAPRVRNPNEPLVPGFLFIRDAAGSDHLGPPCDVGPSGTAHELESLLLAEGPESVAAFIAEPIPTPGTVRVPPSQYWEEVQRICHNYGVVLIIDEVFNGFGRTGKMFASEHWGIRPDILVVSKGLSSGYVPIAAAIATEQIAEVFDGTDENAFQHGATYSGHPVGCAAALENLAIIEGEGLIENSRVVGGHLGTELQRLLKHDVVRSVNGLGMLYALQLKDPSSQLDPINPLVGHAIEEAAYQRGVICRFRPDSVYIHPPLVTTTTEASQIVDVLDEAISSVVMARQTT